MSELEAAEVYPTLILAAAIALRELGIEDAHVTQARRRAERAIQPLTTLDDLADRIGVFVRDLLGLGEAAR
ncbi:hypothetical protein [Frankia sp. AgKG'84/4]|uniref:hypothetical protein n=1 Tax=Frankia sp. AgKG'84/4 TaxID=573490 RepID=UPI00200BC6AE|nr:hypothetical protein [Frankia sp. AgKG'84/4]MCL9794135.1 hypothetical protein [Frankia sp. AgKG'84/4]